MAGKIKTAIYEHGVKDGVYFVFIKTFSYEVDGFGNHLKIDDANVPSLLSLPHLGFL